MSTPITQAQLDILNRYTCERLTANSNNRHMCHNFWNQRNEGLAYTLQEDAWYEDREGRPTIYYVVKNPEGRIALYFSLRCGVLFDPNYVRNVMERFEQKHALFTEIRSGRDVETLRSGYSDYRLASDFFNVKSDRNLILKDKRRDPNDKLIRVEEAFPAIELVHFCANDWARDEWKRLQLGHSMGEVMFWHFVVPKMLEINQLIGCEYVYLFAADRTPDATLLNYYENVLHFEQIRHIGAIKPYYDFFCIFMAKRLRGLTTYRKHCLSRDFWEEEDPLGLEDYRKAFFENFNIDPNEDPV